MPPRFTRREYLSSVSVATIATLAGCVDNLSNGHEPTPSNKTETELGTEATGESRSTRDVAGNPENVVREFVMATGTENDPAVVRDFFHPIHPFHPDNLDADTTTKLLMREKPVSGVQAETIEQNVTPAVVLTSPLLNASDVEKEAVADALADEQTAVVHTTVTVANGDIRDYRTVTVTNDGEWVILARGIKSNPTAADEDYPLDTRVVDDVTFDSQKNRARVHFVEFPTADSITVKAENSFSSRSSDTPKPLEYFDVYLDPNRDAVIVTATIDGETSTVYRERYPDTYRIVENITFKEVPNAKQYDAVARVSFTGNQTGDRLVVESSVKGDKAVIDSPETAETTTVGIDPDGDQIIVTRTSDGQNNEVHRERYHP